MKKMKKISAVMVALIIALCLMVFSAAAGSDDFEYESYGEGTIGIISCYLDGGDIEIPSEIDGKTVVSICDYTFEFNSMSAVTIPVTVERIGDYAFDGCDGLSNVYYNGSAAQWNAISIGEGNEALLNAEIHFAETVCSHENVIEYEAKEPTCTEDGYTSGKYCSDCETWVEGHEEISAKNHKDDDADKFCDTCEEYQGVLIEAGHCGENVNYKLYEDGMLVISGEGDMWHSNNWDPTVSVFYESDIESVVIANGVTSVGDYAFCGCKNLTSITISDSVTKFGKSAFAGCETLSAIKIPDSVTFLDSSAFYGCKMLESVVIPDSVEAINPQVFMGCTNLKSVTFGKNLKYIGDSMFGHCTSLTSVIIPERVEEISNQAFMYCDKLECVELPDNLKLIKMNAFKDCTSLKSITIPDGVTSIGSSAFSGCSGLVGVKIGKGVTSIGAYAFQDCIGLKSITIPNSVTSIGLAAFGMCPSLTEILVDIDNENFSSESGVLFNKDKTKLICCPAGKTGKEYSIPVGVKEIDTYAFIACSSLNSISIPDGLISIGFGAFGHCVGLADIIIPDSVTSMGDSSFFGCKSLESVIIGNGITCISKSAFDQCENLTGVIIPISVTSVGDNAFDHCYKLSTIYYGGSKNQWENMAVKDGNYYFANATIYYNHGKNHTYKTVTTKATLTKNGKIESKCSCGKVKSTQTIAKISSVTLSVTKYIHDGKNKTPTVTVKDANGKTLVKNTDYKLSVASSRKGIGKYTVKVTFIGKYEGTKNVYFTILPGKPATVKASSQTTSSVKLTWSKVSGAAGYTVYRYSPSKKAYVKAGTTEGTSLTVKGLLTGTKYTFKVVAYGKTSGGKVYNSEGYTLLKTATKTKTPELTKVTASSTKGKAYVYHSNVSGETGYTVYYSTSKTSGFKKYANFKADTTTCNITKLTSGKTYYFKVRTYIKTDSGYVYSPWSAVKGIKVK